MSIAELIFCTALVFGPIIGYIAQYQEIQRTGDPSGFSTLVCFILIVANVLRVFFWFLRRFEVSLLAQSIVMVVAQLVLLELIVRVKLRRHPAKDQAHNYDLTRGFTFDKFWKWDYFGQYVAFVVTFLVAGGSVAILNYTVFHSSILTEAIGSLALLIESMLAMPQCYQNWRNKSCQGLRKELVMTWFAGDAFKTAFFVTRHAPPQFVLCGTIQLIVDAVIAVQIRAYSNSPAVAPHLQPSTPQAPSSTSIFKEDAEYEFTELGQVNDKGVEMVDGGGEEERRTTIETAFLADSPSVRDHSNKALYGTF